MTQTIPLTETALNAATLACSDVTLAYTDGGNYTTYALKGVSVNLTPGQFYGIMGPSGSGKSSLLYILSGLKPPTEGTARFGDFVYARQTEQAVTRLRREKFGFVFQQPFLLPYLTALENVIVAAPAINKLAREQGRAMLSDLGLDRAADKLPSQLSGGEKQRVSVARAMIGDPEVIFADEPTASLDHGNGIRVMETLIQWRGRGGTVVVVTHDPEMLSGADRVILLRDGTVVPA